MSLMDEQVISYCLNTLKARFKTKGVTYQDVANYLAVSEVTVKRMMQDTDIRFERLLKLCALAELSIDTLISEATNSPATHYVFTAKQDAAFAKHAHLLAYFSALVYEKLSVEQIQDKYQLDSTSSYLYLRALEKIELINLLPENKVQYRFKLPLGFAADSQVLKKQTQFYIEQTVEQVLNGGDEQAFMLIKPVTLPIQVYEKMLSDLGQVVDKYSEISESFEHEQGYVQKQVMVLGHTLTDFSDTKIIPVCADSFTL